MWPRSHCRDSVRPSSYEQSSKNQINSTKTKPVDFLLNSCRKGTRPQPCCPLHWVHIASWDTCVGGRILAWTRVPLTPGERGCGPSLNQNSLFCVCLKSGLEVSKESIMSPCNCTWSVWHVPSSCSFPSKKTEGSKDLTVNLLALVSPPHKQS